MNNSNRPVEENIKKALEKAISYREYRDLVKKLAETNSNSGPIQTDTLINYTQLNDRRMKRWDKTLKISKEYKSKIANLNSKTTWLVLTESWCGDASPSLPVMNKMAELNSKLDLKIVLRDENLELMNLFLTNGAQSIPKLIALNSKTHTVLGEWGPRPSTATKMVNDYKTEHGKLSPEFKENLQVWYNKDKGQTILDDLVKLLTLK
ncbi:thioredoxin family protein [Croceitalea vernalis]|uniref:Thioredoxin family protein n=1 Tax=Croceitalea vernalis TaxID=3075599 RepID=A0ABU3BDQ2_9FLAO|nr:thioredoxin family protein [Croceitalea sp. P007]MDT0620147.1 thioredoxin family protein [Croceitalea sp. P007]